ncbi:SPOR domain-containing protein [Celeribacter neptunius]|uniref:Sporulation related domain-containing protein n=1 Tax=Celeribacter neptunius TaxID=588602 RepID=A0A1I3W9G4_9RHOB|nr:SPOR domain-containing protein [Celeribacter neptunius]SFK04145.1 Sporulation related domain-containing protein [Celeribacter neptunius]
MQAVKTISVAVLIATLGVSALSLKEAAARSLYNADGPAEFPPLSYKGTQYVDSRGCAYVRSGDGAAVHWVPRVTRSRQVLCGFKPTFADLDHKLPVIPDPDPATTVASAVTATPTAKSSGQAAAPMVTAGTATSVPAPQPEIAAPKPAAVAAKPALPKAPPLPGLETLAGRTFGERGCVAEVEGGQLRCSTGATEYILKRLPAGVSVRLADGSRMTTTEPTMVRVPVKSAPSVQVATAPLPTPMPILPSVTTPAAAVQAPMRTAAAALATQCAGLSGNAAQYMTSSRYTVRCGPQVQHPSAYIQRQAQTRVSTQNVRNQVARNAGLSPYDLPAPVAGTLPAGYTRAWTDGRLNPNRGPLTARGDLQMAQVWSQTTPAHDLYAPRRMTFWQWLFGSSFKPRSTVAKAPAQTSAGVPVQVSTKSVAPSRTPTAPRAVAARPATPQSVAAQPQQSTAQSLRYVQVGTFGVPENAERSMARLSAMGLPVATQVLHRNGKVLKSVLAGPFARPEQTLSALASVRGAGYGDAFARK